MTAEELRPLWEMLFSFLRVVASSAFVGGAIGLLLSLPVIALLWRRRVFQRQHPTWNLLAKLAYPYLVAVFLLAGAGLASLRASHHYVRLQASQATAPLPRAKLPVLKEWLVTKADWGEATDYSLAEATRRVLASAYYPPASDQLLEKWKARAINYVTLNVGKWVVAAGLGVVIAYAAGRAGDTLGLDDESVRFSIDVIKEMDLSRVDENFFQILDRAILSNVDKVFQGLYLKAALLILLALLVPLAEWALHSRWRRQKAMKTL